MAPNDEIRNFITQKNNYSYGVNLLSSVNKNFRLIHTLMRKESSLNWDKLIYELKKHLKQNSQKHHGKEIQQVNKKTVSPETNRPEPYAIPKIHNEQVENRTQKELHTPSVSTGHIHLANNHSNLLAAVKEKQVLLYRERGHLHGRLHEAKTQAIRKKLAKDIISIQEDIESVNTDLALISEGKVPRELVLKMMTGEQHKEYRNTQNYVVRYRNYLKKEGLTDEKRANYQAKLDEYQAKLENYFSNV